MLTSLDPHRLKLVDELREAVRELRRSLETGRLGFDYAVKEYTELYNNELSHAFQQYVWIMRLEAAVDRESPQEDIPLMQDTRRNALRAVAASLDIPEVTELTEALIRAQDRRVPFLPTLEDQAERLGI
jgi:hypothetical protein